jgi:signal transduction histidine kinase
MRWINKSLFRRLLISYLVTVLLGLGLAGITMSFLIKKSIYETAHDELLRKAKKVNLAIQNTPDINDKTMELLTFFDQTFDTPIWVFNRQGKIIATSIKDEVFQGKTVPASIMQEILAGHDVVSEVNLDGMDKPFLSAAIPWGKKDQIYGGIILQAPVEGIDKTLAYMRETVLWAVLFGILLSTAMVSYLSWSISRPLQKIDRTALEIGLGNYDRRVHVQNPDEIGDLAQTINILAEKLENIERDRRWMEKVYSEYLSNVSHELRTPLTALKGFLEALQDGLIESEDERQKYFHVMYQETLHMSCLIDDLMDLIKLEKKEVSLFKTAVDLEEVINKVAFLFRHEAAEKQTSIEIQVVDDLPKIYADKHRVVQVFKNLLHNAVKFTDQGKIKLIAVPDGTFVKVQVADTGMGIPHNDLERIWERFFKGDRVRSKNNKGTGLGLAIVKQIVELHDGKITVESELGKGTVFTLWLPVLYEPQMK